MAREIYIDCIRRDPDLTVEAICHDLQALRPGASCVVVLADDPSTMEAVLEWADAHRIRHTILGHAEYWSVRLFVLPDDFGELPPLVRRAVAA